MKIEKDVLEENFFGNSNVLYNVVKKNKVDVSESLEDLLASEQPKKQRFNNPPTDNSKTNQQQPSPHANISQANGNSSNKQEMNEFNIIDLGSNKTAGTEQASETNATEIRGGLAPNLVEQDGFFHCPPAIAVFRITQKVFDDIIMVAKAINELSQEKFGHDSEKLEVFVYLFAEPDEIMPAEPARASSIYIPFHEASEAHVNVNEVGILDIQKYVRESGKILVGWSHSHGHYEVYSSQTDDINHQIILNETNNFIIIQKFSVKYIYSLTVVESGDNYPVVLTQYPCGHIEQTKAQLDIKGNPYSTEEAEVRYKELKDILRIRATIIRPTTAKSFQESLQDLSEELIGDFIQKLWKSKALLIEKITPEHEKAIEIIQKYLQDYDKLLISGAEESFKSIAQKILGFMLKTNNSA